jgi:hypothetical protein
MSAPDMPAPEIWVRAEDAVTRTIGDELFVALLGEGSLNAMAAAVWRALEEPRTLAELRTLFGAAFPDIDPHHRRSRRAARNARTRRPGAA